MKAYSKNLAVSQMQITLSDFLNSYNNNIPEGYPQATAALLEKYKETHSSLFKHGDNWSLDTHRKKIMDWLPLNS